MNKINLITTIVGFAGGTVIGNLNFSKHYGKWSNKRLIAISLAESFAYGNVVGAIGRLIKKKLDN